MSDKERISATVDPEVREYLREAEGSISDRINNLVREEMLTDTMSTRERIEARIEEVDEEISDLKGDLRAKKDERAELVAKLDSIDDRESERLERICAGLCIIKGTMPDQRETNAANAAKKAGMSEEDILQLAEDINIGYYSQGGFPDSLTNEERELVVKWVSDNF